MIKHALPYIAISFPLAGPLLYKAGRVVWALLGIAIEGVEKSRAIY